MEVVWVEGEGLTVSAVVLVGEGAGLGTVRLEGTWSLAIAEVEVVRGLGEGLAAPPVGAEVVGVSACCGGEDDSGSTSIQWKGRGIGNRGISRGRGGTVCGSGVSDASTVAASLVRASIIRFSQQPERLSMS